MTRKHIVRSYDEDLDLLKAKILEMGEASRRQLADAAEALRNRDSRLAADTIQGDDRVDALQTEFDALAVRLLARRAPLAHDLRNVVAGLKTAVDLERIADYAANIARHVIDPGSIGGDQPVQSVLSMTLAVLAMLDDVLDAYGHLDVEQAKAVWHRDDAIDQAHSDLLTQFRSFLADGETCGSAAPLSALLFVSRHCERIGDHIKNIAENIHYIVRGRMYCGKPCDEGEV